MSNIVHLEAARDNARKAATHPKVLALRGVLSSPTATTPEKHAAKEALAGLRAERKQLRDAGAASLVKTQTELSAARRAEREAKVESIATELRTETLEQLTERRANIETERRRLKKQHRAVVKVLGERDSERRVSDMVATMSDADKRALLLQLQTEGIESEEAVGTPGR